MNTTLSESKHKLEVRETGKYGKGVFAGALIKQGETIHVLSGKEIDETLCDQMISEGKLNNDDPLQNYIIKALSCSRITL